ncbi:hypothetical protein [Labrenzia sp. 011]|uniref:hypothetical protein n=1 Tax=Labrenzia sp. 011 TaxID=2171494 RepID=UPI00105731EE|nr:hypothetical protein [Labrenzia sp. 011]
MGSRISLRDDFDAWALRRLADQSRDANQTRRLLALASIYGGGKRLEAAGAREPAVLYPGATRP